VLEGGEPQAALDSAKVGGQERVEERVWGTSLQASVLALPSADNFNHLPPHSSLLLKSSSLSVWSTTNTPSLPFSITASLAEVTPPRSKPLLQSKLPSRTVGLD
jgi:hypothetical protein